ncbi:hypothetical protein JCM15457_200 [Liquorilactobacillus sucicola DSM 21376 = JCM 15457]|uniref:Uncharacterized protein n=2 Tax=Liquorilactobacillus sucicola TaxID=519050 RepID=A0A023CUX7_9LACO|nr:hypothetical protein FD15_GL001826 [Liquorilactobacillus sucicola DSM 21376 = JCM 15457]GAJ25340.1 hypothetical protein JCM15457_200 [Liquorilactobacillus sucicola DSM 21376 = JCM 15457]
MHFFIWLVFLIIILLVFIWGKRMLRQKALKILLSENKKITDKAVSACLPRMHAEWLQNYSDDIEDSKLLANIWGKGVMVFEYILPVQQVTQKELKQFRKKLNHSLGDYAENNDVAHLEGSPAFLISDLWFLAPSLHIEVAYISNQQTLDYLKDIKKLEK